MVREPLGVNAPESPPAEWINTPEPVTLAGLSGRVILADFWDFTSLPCLKSLPYRRAWAQRYTEFGLVLLGIHTSRYHWARSATVVAEAAARLGVTWPSVFDRDGSLSRAYRVRTLPTAVLIDHAGSVQGRFAGPCGYAQVERGLRTLLRRTARARPLPDPLPPLGPEDAPGAYWTPTTPHLEIGSLGNPVPPLHRPALLEAPPVQDEGHFYLDGVWQASSDGLTLVSQAGAIHLPYRAAAVYAVLSPAASPLELAHDPDPPLEVQILQDNLPLPQDRFAEDVYLAEGQARLRVDRPRLYALVRNADVRPHRLRLEVRGAGLTLCSLSFGTCAEPAAPIESRLSHTHPHLLDTE